MCPLVVLLCVQQEDKTYKAKRFCLYFLLIKNPSETTVKMCSRAGEHLKLETVDVALLAS